jgi:hypothetical protein
MSARWRSARVAARVLEHLYDPWRALTRIRTWLAADTRVLASVPNIRNLVNLHELAAGAWEYGPHGVLDVTHVRVFYAQLTSGGCSRRRVMPSRTWSR